ncbi:hypothetical protein [Paenibacillus sp. FJAT-26967]|uniref:hypothetical protein n=1 Tax=Paenibacillus sp. FJAT-26967 TaxID=1729690 RepID=UPI0008392A9C|nr:hypothetical protein [Paenibacillus sp. FJAT-26967]
MSYQAKTDWKLDDTVTENDLNRIELGIGEAHTSIDSIEANIKQSPLLTPVTLNNGVQVVNASRTSPFRLESLKGRTLVNLLGKLGNGENVSKWSVNRAIAGTTSNIWTSGKSAVYVTAAEPIGEHFVSTELMNVRPNKNYCVIGDMKTAVGAGVYRVIAYDSANKVLLDKISIPIKNEVWEAVGFRFTTPSGTLKLEVRIQVLDAALMTQFTPANPPQQVFADSIRLYEISQSEYDYISGTEWTEYAKHFPYVDSVQHTTGTYVTKTGENLAPSSESWIISTPSHSDITGLYSTDMRYKADANVFVEFFAPVVPGQHYTPTVTTKPANAKAYYYFTDANKRRLTDVLRDTKPAPANAAFMEFVMKPVDSNLNPIISEVVTYSNPMIVIGTASKPFKPREDDYLFFPDIKLASSVDGSVCDEVTQRDGKYWKTSKHQQIILDGSLDWKVTPGTGGGKTVELASLSAAVKTVPQGHLVKHNGNLIKNDLGGVLGWTGEEWQIGGNNYNILYLRIANSDSGWGPDYTPTADEIKAYFNGWRMFRWGGPNNDPYNTTDNSLKAWVQIGSLDAHSPDYTVRTVPTVVAPNFNWVPYHLNYQLEQPTVKEITPEGSITLHEGLNQIEVGVGMIVREQAKPSYNQYGNTWHINMQGHPSIADSGTRYAVNKILSIYRGRLKDTWRVITAGNGGYAFGEERAEIPDQQYGKDSPYSITYLAFDQYAITAPVGSLTGSYASNLKTTLDTVAANQANVETRVSILESIAPNKAQPQWIAATLLNGWLPLYGSTQYYKDSQSNVRLRGRVSQGAITIASAIFYLPVGYRPSRALYFPILQSNGFGYVTIFPTGAVCIESGSNDYALLDSITFNTNI